MKSAMPGSRIGNVLTLISSLTTAFPPGLFSPASGALWPGFDFLNEKVVLTQAGKELAQGTGALAMGHPAKAVAWLVGKLADRNKGLEAGQVVMTGTLTPILPIEKGATYVAKFSTLGEVTATFL